MKTWDKILNYNFIVEISMDILSMNKSIFTLPVSVNVVSGI